MQTQSGKFSLTCAIALAMIGIGGPAAADTISRDITEARQETQIWTTYALSPCAGVVAVDNQLVVNGASAAAASNARQTTKQASTETSDGWITTKVKSTYMFSSNVDGSDITVSTKGGIVTPSGKVDSGAERALAIELANNVRGVKSVQSKGLTI